jgi:hypothetical protein
MLISINCNEFLLLCVYVLLVFLGVSPAYLRLPYTESALALIQHMIRYALSDRPAEKADHI